MNPARPLRSALVSVLGVALVLGMPTNVDALSSGRQIAFDQPTVRGDGEIFTVDLSTRRTRNVTRRPGDDFDPVWSPNGELLAFTSYRRGSYDIFTIRPDGSGLHRVTRSPMSEYAPAWSPSGKRLVYVRGDIAVAPGQRGVADLFTIGIDGSGPRRLTRTIEGEFYPAWSPDGAAIAFARSQSRKPQAPFDIFLLRLSDGRVVRLTRTVVTEASPDWSPDAERVVFVRRFPWGNDLFLMEADGDHLTRLTKTPQVEEDQPSFSSDGSWIAFTRDPVGRPYGIAAMSPEGTHLHRLTAGGANPDWRPWPNSEGRSAG